MSKIRFLSNNALKIIAALAMLADHAGYLLFPDVTVLRIIGRLAFPIFAFTIAEWSRTHKPYRGKFPHLSPRFSLQSDSFIAKNRE